MYATYTLHDGAERTVPTIDGNPRHICRDIFIDARIREVTVFADDDTPLVRSPIRADVRA